MKTIKILPLLTALIIAAPGIIPNLSGEELPERIVRFEQMILRTPGPGPAFDQVRGHFQGENRLNELRERWEQALAEDEEKAPVYHFLLGLLAESLGDNRTARDHLRQATEAENPPPAAWQRMAEINLREGAMREGIDAYRRALEMALPLREEQEVRLALGRAKLRVFDHEGAKSVWRELRERFPDDAFIQEEIGEALLQAGEFEEARETLRMLVESPETDSFRRLQARIWISDTHARQGQWEEALEGYVGVFRQTQPGSWLQRAALTKVEDLFFRRGRTDDLVAFYRSELDNRRSLYPARRLHQLLIRLRDQDAADALLREIAGWAPDNAPLQGELARLHMRLGEWEAAEAILQTLVRRHPEEWIYRENLGELYLRRATTGDRERAAEAWAGLAPEDLTDPYPVVRLGDLYRRYEWREAALVAYRRALSLAPYDFALREKTGLFLFDLGREEEGWRILRGDGEPLPTAENYLRLARLEHRHDKAEAALASVRAGLALDETRFPLWRFKWQLHTEQERWAEALELIPRLQEYLANEFHQPTLDNQHRMVLDRLGKLEETRTQLEHAFRKAVEDASPMNEDELRFYLFLASAASSETGVGEILEQALRWYPESFVIQRQRYELARAARDLEAQTTSLRRLIELRPARSGEWLRELSQVYLGFGDTQKALEVGGEWIRFQPANAEAHLHLAEVHFRMGNTGEGNRTLQQALQVASDPVPVRERTAEAFQRQGRHEDALEQYREIFRVRESRRERLSVLVPMVEAYRRSGRSDAMVQWFDRHFPEIRETADYHFFRGAIHLEQEDYASARTELERAWALEPTRDEIAETLIRLALEEEEFEEAVRVGREWFARSSTVENEMILASLLLRADEVDEALSIIARNGDYFVAHEKEWPEFFSHVRSSAMRDELVGIIRNHLPSMDNPWTAEIALAEFFIEQGLFEEARDALWRVYQIPPDDTLDAEIREPGPLRAQAGAGVASLEIEYTRMAVNGFAQMVAHHHPLFRQRHTHRVPSHYHSARGGLSGGSLSEINQVRARALGYLMALAKLEDREDDFIERWDAWLQSSSMPVHRLIVEKVAGGHFEELFFQTMEDLIAGRQDMDPGWRKEIDEMFQTLTAYRYFTRYPDEIGERILAVVHEWMEEEVDSGENRRMTEIYEWFTQLQMGQVGNEDPDELFSRLDAFREDLKDDVENLRWVDYTAFMLALGLEDVGRMEERFDRFESTIKGHSVQWMPHLAGSALGVLSVIERPLHQVEWNIVRKFIPYLGRFQQGWGAHHHHQRINIDTFVLGMLISEEVSPAALEAWKRLYESQKRHVDMEVVWKVLQEAEVDETTPRHRRSLQVFEFFMHLWEGEHAEAIQLGEDLLAGGDDVGVRLNLGLLYEKKGSTSRALSLLDGAQLTGSQLFPINQLKMIHLAATDEELHPVGQMAVHRLSRNWNQYRHRVGVDLQDLYHQVGMHEEWQRREELRRQTEATSPEREEPRWEELWLSLRRYAITDAEERVAGAKEVLRLTSLGFQDPVVRQDRNLHYSRNRNIRELREAKEGALAIILGHGDWDAYIEELRVAAEENPTSLEGWARLAEAHEFLGRTVRRKSTRGGSASKGSELEYRVQARNHRITLTYREPGEEVWRDFDSFSRTVHPLLFDRPWEFGVFLSSGVVDQPIKVRITDLSLRRGREEMTLDPVFRDAGGFELAAGEGAWSMQEDEEGGLLVSVWDGANLSEEGSPHGLLLGREIQGNFNFHVKVSVLESNPGQSFHGIWLRTVDDEIEQYTVLQANEHGGPLVTYSRITRDIDPTPYYERIFAIRPRHPYFTESYSRWLFENNRNDELIAFHRREVEENPYLVLRGDNERLTQAWSRSGELPGLVDRFLAHPAMDYRLSHLGHHMNPLGQILNDVGDHLEKIEFVGEANRVRSRALEVLPLRESEGPRIGMIRTLSAAGDEDTVFQLLRGYFEGAGQEAAPRLLIAQTHTGGEPSGGWLSKIVGGRHSHGIHPSLQLVGHAHPSALGRYVHDWREGNPDLGREQGASDVIIGLLLHWGSRHHEFGEMLLLAAELFGPSGSVAEEWKQWFGWTLHFPMLEMFVSLEPEEGHPRREELSGHLLTRQSRPGVFGRLFGNRSTTIDPLMTYRTKVLLGNVDSAWEDRSTIISSVKERGGHSAEHHWAFFHYLREAARRLGDEEWTAFYDELSASSTRISGALMQALYWEDERRQLRAGEVRMPFVSFFLEPGDQPFVHYEISSIHPEDSFHRGRQGIRSWLYGEPFVQLDGRYDLVLEVRDFVNRTERDSRRFEAVTQRGAIPFPMDLEKQVFLLHVYPKGGDTPVYSTPAYYFMSGKNVLPSLDTREMSEDRVLQGWTWMGIPPRPGPANPIDGESSLYFPGYGIEDHQVAISDWIDLEGSNRIYFQSLLKHSSNSPAPFQLLFYNADKEEILERSNVIVTSSPSRWIVLAKVYLRGGRSQFHTAFPSEARYLRVVVQTQHPMNVSKTRVFLE